MACWLDAVTPAPSLEQLRMVLHTVTRGVEFLHMKDVIHCDLKLENIFMSSSAPNASPVIGDFDVSKDLDARRIETTATSSGGTSMYLSPERQDHQPATAATDVYALGVVFVLALSEKDGRAGLLQSLQKLAGVSVREALLGHITGPLVTVAARTVPDSDDSVLSVGKTVTLCGLSDEAYNGLVGMVASKVCCGPMTAAALFHSPVSFLPVARVQAG